MSTDNLRLPPSVRRTALEQLSRERLAEITDTCELEVADRRVTADHINAIVRTRSLDFAHLLRQLKREELQAICRSLQLSDAGREKELYVTRIMGLATSSGDGTEVKAPPPATPAAPLRLVTQEPDKTAKRAPQRTTTRTPTHPRDTGDYRHDHMRTNNPSAGLIEFDKPPPRPTKQYKYDPHLDPTLQWSGKAERTSFEVDTVSLHIHERVSTQAILKAVKRENAQGDLFAKFNLADSQEIDFYQHEVDWSNRMILGDSLLVMNSLLEREHMAGRVQCIYIDPPYGVKFNSNFQPSLSRRDVKDGDDASLTREPEQIQAYRDTWTLGVHSYLTYLRDRLLLARELLSESGSVFVQISEENVHFVRCLMDELFGRENFVTEIYFRTTTGQTEAFLATTTDTVLWYARDRQNVRYRQLYVPKGTGEERPAGYSLIRLPDGTDRRLTQEEREGTASLPNGARLFSLDNLVSQGFRTNTSVTYQYAGQEFDPGPNQNWKTTVEGLDRLAHAGRLGVSGSTLRYVRLLEDFPVTPLANLWVDTSTGSFTEDKLYVVQTNVKVIARCILMTTDPGDLVLDPTCGSGTTAHVAEQWGRRWITCDTSRVALALARQRLLTAKYPYYKLRSARVRDGFLYRTVPHITLKSIAQNPRLDECKTREERERAIRESADQEVLYDQPESDNNRIRVSGPFTVEAIPKPAMSEEEASPIAPWAPSLSESHIGIAADARPAYGPSRLSNAAGDYIGMMIDLLKKSGVAFSQGGELMRLPTLRPVRGSYEWLHAEAELGQNGGTKRVAVSFGPRHAPVTPVQVRDGIGETRGYDLVLFVGFACDPEARRMIDQGIHGRTLHFANAAPDILVNDPLRGEEHHLLKTTRATRLFTVFGAPDIVVHREKDGQIVVELIGVDLYDPNTGETHHGKGSDVPAWFVDHDYDGRCFCIGQALFPSGAIKNPWEKLQKALKGVIDEDKFEALRSTRSLPFAPGKKVAVTVIDDRGNEVIKVLDVPSGGAKAR